MDVIGLAENMKCVPCSFCGKVLDLEGFVPKLNPGNSSIRFCSIKCGENYKNWLHDTTLEFYLEICGVTPAFRSLYEYGWHLEMDLSVMIWDKIGKTQLELRYVCPYCKKTHNNRTRWNKSCRTFCGHFCIQNFREVSKIKTRMAQSSKILSFGNIPNELAELKLAQIKIKRHIKQTKL
jgi:hypothetical protein